MTAKKKTKLLIDIMKWYLKKKEKVNNVEVGAGWPSQSFIEKCDRMIQIGKKKQYAFAIVFNKNGDPQISPLIDPDMDNNSDSTENDLHSEEILITVLDHHFQNNGNNVTHVFIYTHFSPCKEREEECRESCMLLLTIAADRWKKDYGFSTEVVYKESWGVGPDYFNYLKYSDIYPKGIVNIFFEQFIDKCANISFKLVSKYFNEMDPETFENEEIQNILKQLKELANSVGLRKDHLEKGEEIIVRLENIQGQGENIVRKCKTWRMKLYEMINNSFMIPIRERVYKDFNAAVDYIIAKDLQLDDKIPFKLHHILDRNKNMLK